MPLDGGGPVTLRCGLDEAGRHRRQDRWRGMARQAAGIEHSRRSVEGMALDDGLVPLRPGRDEVDRDPGERFDAIEVGTGARGQIGA